VKKWYDQNQDKYLLPETVNLQYIELTREHAESGIQVTEPALKEYFEQVKDRFTTQERRHGRHILITVGEGVDDAAAKQKAEELTAKAKAGADFAQLAKDNSKDPARRSRAAISAGRSVACSSARSRTRCSRCRSARSAGR
jgi:peptidyl-prolyl cis-trans isomerase D